MVERIRLLLQAKQLSPTQFADTIGVARPIVSHILSGRNKPSLEVVQKILAAFPEVSMAWLLNGVGAMEVAAGMPTPMAPAGAASASLQSPVQRPAKVQKVPVATAGGSEAGTAPVAVPESSSQPILEPAAAPLTSPVAPMSPLSAAMGPPPPITTDTPFLEPTSPVPTSQAYIPPVAAAYPPPAANGYYTAPPTPSPAAPPSPTAAALFAAPEKAIRRIVIFYKDGSFADYHPE